VDVSLSPTSDTAVGGCLVKVRRLDGEGTRHG
jgi:hypothetical protein